jgi:hypothetical protein
MGTGKSLTFFDSEFCRLPFPRWPQLAVGRAAFCSRQTPPRHRNYIRVRLTIEKTKSTKIGVGTHRSRDLSPKGRIFKERSVQGTQCVQEQTFVDTLVGDIAFRNNTWGEEPFNSLLSCVRYISAIVLGVPKDKIAPF